jgi:hypothetical protein
MEYYLVELDEPAGGLTSVVREQPRRREPASFEALLSALGNVPRKSGDRSAD